MTNGICGNRITPRWGFGFLLVLFRRVIPCTIDYKAFSLSATLFLFLILAATPVSAQIFKDFPKNFKLPVFLQPSANKLYNSKQYYAAAQAFEKDLASGKGGDPQELRRKTGLCYLNINQPQKALFWLEQVTEGGNADADTWYQYGLALQQTANYLEAITAFEECLEMQPGHPMVSVKIESCRFAMIHHRNNSHIKFRPATEVNTAGGEFGASLYANNMVYYSSAAAPDPDSKIDQRTGLQYVQTWMMRMQNKKLIYPQVADNTLPNFVNESLFTYDSIARCVYFDWCDPNNNRCGLYTSKFANGKWTEPEIILLNKKDQVSGHPAIANGGNRLYFTTNLSDGVGQTDIWYMDKSDDGKWGPPVNAGDVINTYGREDYPFVYADTLFFFASDGHVGYGGLDIFCSVIRDDTFLPPVNLLRPFNSPGDDFNLVISSSAQTGLLSSSRNESLSDDMYFFEGVPSFHYLNGYVTDNITDDSLNNVRITLRVDDTKLQETVSDGTGYYAFFLHRNESPTIYSRVFGYSPSLTNVNTTSEEQFVNFRHDIRLEQSTILPATIQLYNKNGGKPISERGIICFNNDGEIQDLLRTDATGSFKLYMQEDQREYWIKLADGTYLTESIMLNDEQKSYSLAMQPIDGDLFTGWLNFKRGTIEVTEMSQALIPRIASVIKNNQDMIFQIEGFCEAGFEARQQNLSMQRAEYIVKRLIEEGVESRQLRTSAADAVTDLDEENVNMRRVEIKIIK